VSRRCFKTAIDTATAFNRQLQYHAEIDLYAGGCFAFGGTPAQVRACLCGARNRNNQWARTGTLEPNGQAIDSRQTDDTIYKWMLSSAERTRLGCTTN